MLAKAKICRRRRKAKAMMRGEGGRPRPFEDRKPSVEEQQQQLEKKRPREEGSQFEEEPKRRRTKDDVDLHDFDEDSDDDKDDDFMSRFKIAEYDDWNGGKEADEMVDCDRKCLKVRRCQKHQHPERFSGVPLFEIFSVKLKLNNKYFGSSSVEGPLYGILEVDTSDDPKPIPYYRVSQSQSHMNADSIALKLEPGKKLNLPLYGFEFYPLIAEYCEVYLKSLFKFKDDDVFLTGCPLKIPELFGDGKGNCEANAVVISFRDIEFDRDRDVPYISRNMLWRSEISRILIAAYCSSYFGARATVYVEILKEGVSSCYGNIYSRPCIFSNRIRLLSLESNQKQKLEQDYKLKLTRSVVAVPSYSSLIIAADLYDQSGVQIVRGKNFFPAKERGRTSKYIKDKNRFPILQVEVHWAC